MERLYDKLVALSKEDYYPMHMPGHKRNIRLNSMGNPYELDITEIEGFDNLHQQEGILLSLSERLSRLYKAGRSYPLVNGSTAGILAGISAGVNRGDKILISRNSHKSVYHAVILMGLVPVYCYPQKINKSPLYGGILPSDIEEALIKHQEIKLVVITSPTYEGMVSDIRSIAGIVHRHGARLLVDEAHGAHFGFHSGFPESAVTLGADLVIQSLHKTLPAFTQSAVLHSNDSTLDHRVSQYLAIYESSSPSYVLMAGIDRCVHLLENNAGELFREYDRLLTGFYRSLQGLKRFKPLTQEVIGAAGIYALDRSKITVSTQGTGLSGHGLQALLREKYHIEMEMGAPDYVLGMTSICDTPEGFERLGKALLEIEKEFAVSAEYGDPPAEQTAAVNEKAVMQDAVMLPSEAWTAPTRQIAFRESAGRISAVFVCLFPPGTPVLIPGEVIKKELIDYVGRAKKDGISVTGLNGEFQDKIEVVSVNY